jgi:hypothetical protein
MRHLESVKDASSQISKECVISTGAADSLIVRRAVERPPHFAFALAFTLALARALAIASCILHLGSIPQHIV